MDCEAIQNARQEICEAFPFLDHAVWHDPHAEDFPSVTNPVQLEILGLFQFAIWKCRCEAAFSEVVFDENAITSRIINTIRDHVVLLDYAQSMNWTRVDFNQVVQLQKAYDAAHDVEYPEIDLSPDV